MRNFMLFIISLFFAVAAQSQQNSWNYLNFECGGYVTEIIPVQYMGELPPINSQVLYARTDVGGVYRSSDNGQNWKSINNYYRTSSGNPGLEVSGLSIQGMAVKDNETGTETVIIATGNYREGMNPTACIFKSTNSGQTWSNATFNDNDGILFQGNNFPVKIGGPCITYDPNNPDWLFTGGMFPSTNGGGISYLYKSVNNGQSWSRSIAGVENFPGIDGECIICISMKLGSDHIWVGTSKRIVYTTNGGANWYPIEIPITPGEANPFIKRIIFKNTTNETVAFFTWGNYENGRTGIGKLTLNTSNNTWEYQDLTSNFNASNPSGLFSALNFVNISENIIIAGLYQRPLKITTNFGINWSSDVLFNFTTGYTPGEPNYHNIPNHQDRGALNDQIYDGISCLTRNPNDWGTSTAVWYMSGGAGGRKTAPSYGVDGSDFGNSKWQYTIKGQTMPVMYDVAFHNLHFNNIDKQSIFMPMSDWTMSWEYLQNINFTSSNVMIPTPFQYDRKRTLLCNYDTYISNVTRILFDPNYPNISYCVGGSVYDFTKSGTSCTDRYFAGFYKRLDVDGSGNNIDINRVINGPFLNIPERAIVDAIIVKTSNNSNKIIALVGTTYNNTPPNGTTTGIFYSTDEGASWNPTSFELPCQDPNISTQVKYSHSIISSLTNSINGNIEALFNGHFSLCDAENGIIYLWLGSSDSDGGGLFVSLNNGDSWAYVPNTPNTGFLGPGSLKYLGNNEIALAVRGFGYGQKGLFKGTINTSDGGVSWSEFGVVGI